MNDREMANQLIKGLGETLTVPDMQLNEQDSCSLLFDEDILLNMEYDPAGARILFYIYLDELPEDNPEPILRAALAANLFRTHTQGATLALEEGTGGIILTYAHRLADLDSPVFETVVENVVQTAEDWKKRLGEIKEGSGQTSTESPSPGMGITYA